MQRAVELGSVISLRQSGFPQALPFLCTQVPWQKRLDGSVGTLPPAAARYLKYHVSHFADQLPPPTWPRISRTTPPSVDHSKVTPSHKKFFRATAGPRSQSLRAVIVHREPRVVHEPRQPPTQCARKLSKAFRQGVARSARASSVSISVVIAATAWRGHRRLPRTPWRPAAPPSGGY